MTAATIEELEGRIRSLERLILAGSHGLSHEIGGVDPVRPQWANGAIGTKVNRQRTTLAASGITATEVQGADPHIKIAFDATYSPTFAGLTITGSTIQLNNPAGTFKYTITAAALLADRILNLPLVTATDVLAALGLAQTWTALQSFGTNLGGTLQTAAQPNVTSLGTLTSLIDAGLLDLSGAAAGQISFPATQNASAGANVLDDYEEGTWTPALSFADVVTGITYSLQAGWYVKVGKLVTFGGAFTLTSKGAQVGNAAILGLPFTVGTIASAAHFTRTVNLTTVTNINGASIPLSDTRIDLADHAGLVVNDAHFTNTTSCTGYFGAYSAST